MLARYYLKMPSLEHNGLWNQETRENVHNREKQRVESSKTGWEIHNEEYQIRKLDDLKFLSDSQPFFETNWIPHEKNSIGSRVFVIAGLGEKQICCKVKFAVHVFINGALIYQIKYKTKKT